MKQYAVEHDDQTSVNYESDGRTVAWRNSNGFFAKLEDDGNDTFIFTWKHGQGSGSITIPAHVIFDLPEMLTILNMAKDYPLFSEARIYPKEPLAVLFKTKAG